MTPGLTDDKLRHPNRGAGGDFAKYPDAPGEVILKADLLSLGRWFTDATLAAPAGSLVKSYRLFTYDLNGHHANMEVWDQRLFEWMNPGKSHRVGYVQEAARATTQGLEVMMPHGVAPRFNQWRAKAPCGLPLGNNTPILS